MQAVHGYNFGLQNNIAPTQHPFDQQEQVLDLIPLQPKPVEEIVINPEGQGQLQHQDLEQE
jgi:hypothetical protein